MPRSYSTTYKETVNSVSAAEAPLLLLEIDHADLATPVRILNDNEDIDHNGDTFTALAFRITLPDDMQQGMPKATLAVDNVGKDLTQWIESSAGGQGATCRIIQVLRSDPDTVEWEITMDLNNVHMTATEVTAELGFNDLLNLPSVPLTYRPDTAPGLF